MIAQHNQESQAYGKYLYFRSMGVTHLYTSIKIILYIRKEWNLCRYFLSRKMQTCMGYILINLAWLHRTFIQKIEKIMKQSSNFQFRLACISLSNLGSQVRFLWNSVSYVNRVCYVSPFIQEVFSEFYAFSSLSTENPTC